MLAELNFFLVEDLGERIPEIPMAWRHQVVELSF
jgi:hypothetical protein